MKFPRTIILGNSIANFITESRSLGKNVVNTIERKIVKEQFQLSPITNLTEKVLHPIM